MLEASAPKRAGTRVVMRSTAWNLLGRAGPTVIALFATPYLLHQLGDSRWGVFTIGLSLIGIFGVFDFGLGRALTRAIAERASAGETDQAASLVLTGMLALTALGAIGAVVAAGLVHHWVNGGLRIAPELRDEVRLALYVLCASAPLVVLNAALWGVIAAFQKFRAANLVNLPIMALYYLGPLAVLQVWNSLVAAMLVLVGCRVLMTAAYAVLCLQAMPSLRMATVDRGALRPLLQLGGWMTVASLAYALLGNADRFIIASMLSAAETGYYTTPLDLMARFSIISVAIMGSAYPAMAGSFRQDPANTAALFRRSALATTLIVFPACLAVVALGRPLMMLWLGADFAGHAAPLLPWLALAVLLGCFDSVTAGLIDGIGRPDINAKLALLDVALYVPALLALLFAFGVTGAAMALVARSAAEVAARLLLIARLYPPATPAVRQVAPAILAAAVLLGSPLLADAVGWKLTLVGLSGGCLLLVIWRMSLSQLERALLLSWAGHVPLLARVLPVIQR